METKELDANVFTQKGLRRATSDGQTETPVRRILPRVPAQVGRRKTNPAQLGRLRQHYVVSSYKKGENNMYILQSPDEISMAGPRPMLEPAFIWEF